MSRLEISQPEAPVFWRQQKGWSQHVWLPTHREESKADILQRTLPTSPGHWPDTSKLHYQWAVFSVGNTGRCSEEASVLGHGFLSFPCKELRVAGGCLRSAHRPATLPELTDLWDLPSVLPWVRCSLAGSRVWQSLLSDWGFLSRNVILPHTPYLLHKRSSEGFYILDTLISLSCIG